MKILHIVGNRPQFIKLAPFLAATRGIGSIDNRVVHSGQHYDPAMSDFFFRDLKLPKPDYNLNAGSGTHGVQTGRILERLDPVLLEEAPDVVLVYGDTNTTLAGALAAYKLNIPCGHVEAGMREFIWRPEEMNKKMADHSSTWCFAPLERAADNLRAEGIPEERIFVTGDITYDVFRMVSPKAEGQASDDVRDLAASLGGHILLTTHRAETVDIPEALAGIIEAVMELDAPVIFPIHPRTRARLEENGYLSRLESSDRIHLLPPLGYMDFLHLLLTSDLVFTDSSGVHKEAFYAEKPCVIVDSTTEYRELVDLGVCTLAGTGRDGILSAYDAFRASPPTFPPPEENPLGSGDAAGRMVEILLAG